MSQLSSQVQDPNWVSVPIAKFSHNTSPYGTRSFVWVHVNNRNDLDIVIRNARVVDDYRNYQDRILMKITGGAEVLETQDLGQLVRFCQEFDPATGAEYPVDIVVKSPFMAMRYPKSINTVRRIQVKFRSDQDFKRTITIMKDLGLHITYKDEAVPAVAPGVSPAPSLVSSVSAATGTSHAFADSVRRPASSSMSTSSISESASAHPVTSSPMKPEFKVPLRPDSAFSDGHGPAVHGPCSSPRITIPLSTSSAASALVPFSPRSKIDSLHQPPFQNTSLYISQIERESQNQRMSRPIVPPTSSGNTNSHGIASLYVSQMQSLREEASERAEATSRPLSASPFFSTTSNIEVLLGHKESPSFGNQRPSSTPVEHSDIHQTWIPPKRELPFAHPRKPSNNSTHSVSNVPTLLPKPTPVTRIESTPNATEASDEASSTPMKKPPSKKRIAKRKAPNTKPVAQQIPNEDVPAGKIAEKSVPKLASIQEEREELSPLAAKTTTASFRPASAPGLISKAILPTKKRTSLPPGSASSAKRPKMVDQSTQTQTLSGRDHTAAQRISSTSTPPDLVADTPSPASPPGSYLRDLDSFITKHNPRPKAKEFWETPGYAEADEGRRHTMLNDFICENLDNADFLQLCQDAEFAWRRIGLGM